MSSAGLALRRRRLPQFARLEGAGLLVVKGGGAIAGGGDDDVERRDSGGGEEFEFAGGARSLGGEGDGDTRLEEAQGIALGDRQIGAGRREGGGEGDTQVAEFGDEIGVEGFGVADHADEGGGAVVEHPLGVGQGGDAADGGLQGFAGFGEGSLVAALYVGRDGDRRGDDETAAAIDLVGLRGNGYGGGGTGAADAVAGHHHHRVGERAVRRSHRSARRRDDVTVALFGRLAGGEQGERQQCESTHEHLSYPSTRAGDGVQSILI